MSDVPSGSGVVMVAESRVGSVTLSMEGGTGKGLSGVVLSSSIMMVTSGVITVLGSIL